MKTRKTPPTYAHARTSFAGIDERMALASLAFSKTWTVPAAMSDRLSCYGHSVRHISKKEGWESRFTWYDDDPRIDITRVRRFIAEGIEKARHAWWENLHPSAELIALVKLAQQRKAA